MCQTCNRRFDFLTSSHHQIGKLINNQNNKVKNSIDDENQEKVDSEDDESEEDEDLSDSSPNIYSSFATVLKEQGFLPSLDSSEKIESIEDLTTALNKEVEIQANIKSEQYLSNIDLRELAETKKELQNLESIDEDYLKNNIEVAKNIIYQDYLNQGLSEDRAAKLLKKTIDLGEDMIIEEALESKISITEYNTRKQEFIKQQASEKLEQEKQEQIQLETKVKELVFESKDLIKGLPVNKALQDRVYKSMTEIVSKNPITGELENKFMKDRNSNPIEFDTRMYYLYEITNGFKDLQLLSKQLGSSAVKNLEKALRQTKFDDNGTPGFVQDPQSYDSPFGSELVL